MHYTITLFFLCVWGSHWAQAQTPEIPAEWGVFEKHVFEYKGQKLPYRLLLPEGYNPQEQYPLLVFLHGAGERGTDNEVNLMHVAPVLIAAEHRRQYPAIVLIPQCAAEHRWVETDWKLPAHQQPETPSVHLSLLMELLKELETNYPINPQRRYVMGLSMGGFGTWDILMRMPDYFAAGVPICGGADNTKAHLLKDTPIWAFHGDKDKVVIPARSKDMVAAVKKAGSTVIRYTEYKDVGHGSWKPALAEAQLWQWLFQQTIAR